MQPENMPADTSALEEALFAEKERAEVTLNSIGDAVVCTDAEGRTTFLNVVAEKLTGWSRQEAIGRPVTEILRIVDAQNRIALVDPMALAGARDSAANLPPDVLLIRRDGSHIPIEDTVAPIHDRKGRVTGAVIVFRDVTVAKAIALRLAHSATHDTLTGLPNRLLLQDRIGQAIAAASRYSSRLAVIFLDLDGFKHVNDSLGHSTGDRLLQSVSERLTHAIRRSDTVSRQGGDEFVILLPEVRKIDDVAAVARYILTTIAQVHRIDEHKVRVTASIGISIYPDDGCDAETLLKKADIALYEAKEGGRRSFRFFKPEMGDHAVERQSIEVALREAVKRRDFVLRFQPKVLLKTGVIVGAEALLHWNHPTLGTVPPAHFIPVAEESGLILSIGSWVCHEACRQARMWRDMGLPDISVAVNVSGVEIGDGGFQQRIFATLRETGIDPKLLELELTESVLMKRPESAASVLETLKAKGVRIAIDDFGTGYSSLAYLQRFPVDTLKLDQFFVRQIGATGDDMPIVTAVIQLAHNLKLRVVAEGVETREQLEFLKDRGCDEAQGFYLSPPLPAAEVTTLLTAGMPLAQ